MEMNLLALFLLTGTTLSAPPAAQADTAAVRQELMNDITTLERKVIGLAQAMDEKQYGWTPMKGVRTVRQVYLHIAVNNYVFPAMTGTKAPESLRLGANFEGVPAYENADLSKAEVIRQLRESFAHLKTALGEAGDLNRTVSYFGRPATARRVWLEALFHIHEHLGQSIAYARSNGVVPPWSR
jgi:uncharacterized damage-inducible protein DinB